MPFYCYTCPECGSTKELMKPMSRCSEVERCEMDACIAAGGTGKGPIMNRNFSAERAGKGMREYAKPFVSDSLAINPEQISEHNRLFPDVTVLSDGRPTFESFTQHDKYLKKTGFRKLPQKVRSKSSVRRIVNK